MRDTFRDDEGDYPLLHKTDLEIFMESFFYTKFKILEDCLMVYDIPRGYQSTMIIQAEELIKKLNLNLSVQSNERNGLFTDTFLVIPNKA